MFILAHYIQYQATCIHLCTDAIGLFHITTEALSLADGTALESIVSHMSRSLRGLAGWSGELPGLQTLGHASGAPLHSRNGSSPRVVIFLEP